MKTRTLANLSRWPEHKVDRLQRALKGVRRHRIWPRRLRHPQPAARAGGRVLGTAEKLGMAELIDPAPSRDRDLACAMLAATVIAPASKLATARGLRADTATSSLGQLLGVSGPMRTTSMRRWTRCWRARTPSKTPWPPGIWPTAPWCFMTCPRRRSRAAPARWARDGHASDGVKGRLQIVYGLLCSPRERPIAIEVFNGNTARPRKP